MRTAQAIVQILTEATKSRSIAFGAMLPQEGYKALGKQDMLDRLRKYRIPEEDVYRRFIILYTDNDGDLHAVGDLNAKLSQGDFNNMVAWLRLKPQGQQTQRVIVDTEDGRVSHVADVEDLFNFQDRNDNAGNRGATKDELDEPFFGVFYHEDDKPPRITKVQGTAKRSGLRPNDEILRVGKNDVAEPGDLKRVIASAKRGEPLTFVIRRAQMYCPDCLDPQSVIPNQKVECTRCGHFFMASNVGRSQFKATLIPT